VGGDVEPVGADVSRADARDALAWWIQAGVDVAIQEEPRNWLKPSPPLSKALVAPEAPTQSNVIEPSQETLAELQQWLASSVRLPLAGPAAKRILPHGPEEPAVMLLSDSPSVEDAAAGQPIGGEAWELTIRMLAAIGIKPEGAYSASLTCFHSPGARMSSTEREGCADIARRHIILAKPKRLLLLGDGPCVALLGKHLGDARGHAHKIEGVRTVATFHPRQLVKQTSNKSYAWQDLLLLMEDES
jgi:uracil-DNA glycosylase family 4